MDTTQTGQSIHSYSFEAGQKTRFTANATARYEVTCSDGTTVEFTVHAGQTFTLTAGSAPGPIGVSMHNIQLGAGDDGLKLVK